MAAPALARPLVTLDVFYQMADLPEGTELADGEIVMTPIPVAGHGLLIHVLLRVLDRYVADRRHGMVFGDGFGYELPVPGRPHTYRISDVSFVRADRIPRPVILDRAWPIAPDLAVEVLSDSDTHRVLHAKLADHLESGTRLLWVVDREAQTVDVYVPGDRYRPGRTLRAGDTLDGGDVVPGFSLPLGELFGAFDAL